MNFSMQLEQLDSERRKVDVDHFDITIRELVRMAESEELKRAPVYQRKFRWNSTRESQLIESLFLGLPVPSIFVATNSDGTWELVDGLQRVSTLMHFVSEDKKTIQYLEKGSNLELLGLEKLSLFNNLRFSDLPSSLQLGFMKRPIRLTALSDKSDPIVRFDLFERLNSGGVVLTPQEVRMCIFRGRFAEFIRDLSEDTKFLEIIKLQAGKSNDGTREEVVLKFFAYFYNRENFDKNVREFLNEYMLNATKNFDYEKGKDIFNKTVDTIYDLTKGKFLRKDYNLTPLNQLEAVMVGIASVIDSGKKVKTPPSDWIQDSILVKYSTRGTNTKSQFYGRINRVIEIFS